jgi:hypothetical protein
MSRDIPDAANDAEITKPLSPLAQHLVDLATASNRAILEQSGLESYLDARGVRCYRARGAGKAQKHANYERKRLETLNHYRGVEAEIRERNNLRTGLPASRDSGPDDELDRMSGADMHDLHGDAE